MTTIPKSPVFAFEGPDGVGKTTIATAVAARLRESRFDVEHGAFPGNDEHTLGYWVYQLHHAPDRFGLSTIPPESLQTLHVAAHLDAIAGWIKGAKARGAALILDRIWWSTVAYAAVAGLSQKMITAIVQPELLYWRAEPPDIVFLVGRSDQFMARSDLTRHHRLTLEYERLATIESQRSKVVRLDNNASVEAAVTRVVKEIELTRD